MTVVKGRPLRFQNPSHSRAGWPYCLQSKQPGLEFDMETKPIYIRDSYKGSGKLEGKVAIITGRRAAVDPLASALWSLIVRSCEPSSKLKLLPQLPC